MKVLFFAAIAVLCTSTALSGEFAFQPIRSGLDSTTVTGVSSDGSVVAGLSGTSAIRWTSQGGVESLFAGSAQGVSPDGKVIVGMSESRPVYWTQDTGVVPLSGFAEGRQFGLATAVSNTGTIYGHVQHETAFAQTAFSWSAAAGPVFLAPVVGLANTTVYAVSDDDQIAVGEAYFAQGAGLATRWSGDGVSTDFGYLPVQMPASTARDITPDGMFIVGRAVQGAYRWTEATGMVSLLNDSGSLFFNEATGISSDGSVIVGNSYPVPSLVAIYWNSAAGAISIAELLHRQGVTEFEDWRSTSVTGISDDGRRIVGYGNDPSGVRTGWIVDLPAPGDANFDDIINGADYTRWADNFLNSDTNWTQGDFNFDGVTDGADYVIWADNFAPQPNAVFSAVPEPSTYLSFMMGAASIAILRLRFSRLA